MAKLSKGNLAAQNNVSSSKVDNWNPPPLTASTAAQMLPPKSRPLPKVPTTPSQKSMTNSANSERRDSSSKKKRRRRGGKRTGDSASEVTTTLSEDVAIDTTPLIEEISEIQVPASQSTASLLPPNASAEELRIFQNEPEMYGVYASSDDGEDQKEEEQSDNAPRRQEETPVYSPSVATGVIQSSPVQNMREDSAAMLRAESREPQSDADAAPSDENKVPAPKKMANGRFKCPLAAKYDCAQTFAHAKGARRHADQHINSDRFKCDQCGKAYSRRDTFMRHMRDQHKATGNLDRVRETQDDQPARAPSKSTVNPHKASKGKGKANSTKDALRNATKIRSNGVKGLPTDKTSLHFDGAVDTDHSAESGAESGSGSPALHAQRQSDDERAATQKSPGHSIAADNLPNSPIENNISPSQSNKSPLVGKEESFKVNGNVKRKRPLPQTSPALDTRLSKRPRKDGGLPTSSFQHINDPKLVGTVSKPAGGSSIAQSKPSQDSDIEMDSENNQDEVSEVNAENTADPVVDDASDGDVDMTNDKQEEESAHENGSSSEEVVSNEEEGQGREEDNEEDHEDNDDDNDDDDNGEEEEEEEEEEESEQDSSPNPQSSPLKGRAKKSKEPLPRVHRQSSMDNFVQRSKSATASTKASASGSRISVDVPVRSKNHLSKVQSKINLPNLARSSQDTDNALSESEEEDPPTQNAEPIKHANKVSRTAIKGKGKARNDEPQEQTNIHDIEEETSSDDRPKATTVARRTSSLGSRNTPRLKNRIIPKKKTREVSDTDESEHTEKPKSKPRPKSRKSSQKEAKAAPTKDSSKDRDELKRGGSTSLANSTWAEASKTGQTGRFTEEEVRRLRAWRESFCQEHNMTMYEFNEMMANSAAVSKLHWRYDWITKSDFMQEFYEQLPYRNRRSMIRFRERYFQNVDNTPWSEAQDKELRQLVSELGTKWVEIAQIMGRTQDSVSQRWRHKLNYGEKPALMGDWTTEEVTKLEEEVTAFARMKNTTPDDGNLHIPWNAISKKLGNGRTAQQCSNRWRINTSKRVNGKFVKVPHSDRIPGEKVQKPRTPSKMEKRLSGQGTSKSGKVYKSAERVEDSSDDDDEEQEEKDTEREETEQEEDEDADDESEEARSREDVEAESEDDADADHDEQNSEDRESDEHAASDSEEAEVATETDAGVSSEKQTKSSAASTTPAFNVSSSRKEASQTKGQDVSRGTSASQPEVRTKFLNSQPESSSSTQSQPLRSSLPPITKTLAVSKNPLRSVNRDHSTPGVSLSLTQLHAGTQANSSAKRTTGRTNRTRVPDSAIVENRPSPQLDLRRRPLSSSSPGMSPLVDTARGVPTASDEEEEEESSSGESGSDNVETDYKSPTSFVSARDAAERSAEDEEETESTEASSDSDSDDKSSSISDSDQQARPSKKNNQDSGSSFWQSVNQNFMKLTGLSQSQSQSRQGRVSLADVLRRGAVEESASDDDDG